MDLVQQYALSMRFVDGAGNVMIAQILSGQEKVATVKGLLKKRTLRFVMT